MTKSISVLIPCYNSKCKGLVATLQRQLNKEYETDNIFRYEIIVADDGSDRNDVIEYNRQINLLPHCRYVIRGKNVGRAAIRNFLTNEAAYDNLLFLDCDITVANDLFIRNYITAESNVVVGGLEIGGDSTLLCNNIRYLYEKASEKAHNACNRAKAEHKEFRTTNFMISRQLAKQFPFNENIKWYGYEDVMMGKELAAENVHIEHIDTPVILDDYEDNATFMAQTEEAMHTLKEFEDELKEYSTLLHYYDIFRKYHLTPILYAIYITFGNVIKNNLTGNKPKLILFNIYKLLYFGTL